MTKLSSATKSAWEALQLPLLHDLEVAASSDNMLIYTAAMDALDEYKRLKKSLEKLNEQIRLRS